MKTFYTSLILIASLGLGACASQVPLATTYPITYQQKMQAAHHWDVLAADVADRLSKALSTQDPSGGKQILNVQGAKCCTVFNYAFHEFLVTRLLEKGFGVSSSPNVGLPVTYQTQVVTHKDRGFIRPTPGLFTGLTAGVLVLRNLAKSASPGPAAAVGLAAVGLDVGTGYITGGVPDNEIIVTTSVMSGDRYLVRISDIYYVNDNNRDQYIAKAAPPTRLMEVVGQ